jgi:DNA recombination protein RmuC
VRAVQPPSGLPPLARTAGDAGRRMIDTGAIVVVLVAGVVVVAAVALWRVSVRLKELEASRGRPDQSVLLLQREIETARSEARLAQAETIGSVRQELQHFSSHMTAQMGQVGTGVARELQHVNQTMGSVQGSLGKLGEVTQRVFDIGKDIAGLEQILRSPKVRGGIGESFLEGLLGQMLPREHYDLQHTFATGDRVDAIVRIGGRLVPIDAKFPLENFRRLLDETDEDKRRALRRAFGRDVKARVDEIAKRYILPDEGTFDFALMYIPAENVYYEIIVKDDGVEDDSPATYAMGRHVIPVSPNSLYAYLQVIVLGLRGLSIEKDAREIQSRLTRLRGDVDKFRDAFDVVGKHLTNARNKYDEAAAGLDRVEAKLEGIESTRDQPALPGIGA